MRMICPEHFRSLHASSLLSPVFSSVRLLRYEDGLRITDPQPLIEYILSCHGNQNQYLVNRYKEFQSFVKEQVGNEFYVTKDAGIFVCML